MGMERLAIILPLMLLACIGQCWGFQEDLSPDLPQKFLNQQNVARAQVGLRPLQWSPQLAQYAEAWAAQNALFGDCGLHHSNGPYGENIFWGSGKDWTPNDAVRDWVNERQWYSYFFNACIFYDDCGHYTQIVWRDTRYVGCARAICRDGKIFMTCNYYPRGNYVGQRPY